MEGGMEMLILGADLKNLYSVIPSTIFRSYKKKDGAGVPVDDS